MCQKKEIDYSTLKVQFENIETFRMEPDFYDGDTCDLTRPRWMTSIPKEGDIEDGEILNLEIPAKNGSSWYKSNNSNTYMSNMF